MVPNEEFHILTIYFEHPKRGQPLYDGQDAWSQWCLALYGGFHSSYTKLLTALVFSTIFVVLVEETLKLFSSL